MGVWGTDPSGAALRLLEVMRSRPEALLEVAALSKITNRKNTAKEIEFQGDELVSAVQDTVKLLRKGTNERASLS